MASISLLQAVAGLVLAGTPAQRPPECAQAFQVGLDVGWALASTTPFWPTPRPAPAPPPVPPFVARVLEDVLRPR